MNKGSRSYFKKAFSLIELMVVISIIAILAAIAVPSYINYTNRAKMSEVYSLIDGTLSTWNNVNSTGNWFNWTIADRYITPTVPELSGIYLNWSNVTFTFTPGYLNRAATTYVEYTPIADGNALNLSLDAHQLDNVQTIAWACDVSGVAGSYGGNTYSVLQFQEVYFPSCSCVTC